MLLDYSLVIIVSHGAAEEGRFLDQRFPWSGFLTRDLVKGEEEMVFLCDLCREFNFDLFVKLWLSVVTRTEGVGK